MKECTYCGFRNKDTAAKCKSCGAADFKNVCAKCGTKFESAHCPNCGLEAGNAGWACPQCGATVFDAFCSKCGYSAARRMGSEAVGAPAAVYLGDQQPHSPLVHTRAISYKNRWILLTLWFFCCFGIFPFYYWYARKKAGFLRFISLNYMMIGGIVDGVMIISGNFRDGYGLKVK